MRLIPSLLCSLALGTYSLTFAATIQVKPANSPAVHPIADAISAASAGDTIELAPGAYFENVIIDKSLTILSDGSAILDGSRPFGDADWQPAGAELPGVFTLPSKHRPAGILLDGKFIVALDFDRAKKSGEWHWKTLLQKGTPLSGFDQIRALFVYHREEKRIYLRLPDGKAPDAASVRLVASDEPLITIKDASKVHLKGLTLQHTATAIALDNAKDSTIENCHILSYEDTGIALTNNTGSCTIQNNQITRGALEEWQPTLREDKPNYEIWRIHKDVGFYDRIGINLFRAGAGNRILNNRIDRTFDGICLGDYACETLAKPLTSPDHGRDTEIAGNLIENTRDSGIELGVGCINVNVHHNILRRTHGGLRFKTPRIGPVFIHHNQLIDGAPFNIWFSMDCSPAEGYIYHNTITGKNPAVAILIHKPTEKFTTPNWHFINNLVLTKEGIYKTRSKSLPDDLQISNHNLVQPPASIDQPIEAAIDAATDLSTFMKGSPLPGLDPSAIKGKAPDLGATEWR